MCRLLTRTALTIDRRTRHGLGPTSRQHRVTSHVRRLLADLHHATHHHVIDETRIEIVALLQGLERLGSQIDRMPLLQFPVALPERGADGIDNHGIGHRAIMQERQRQNETGRRHQ